MNFISIEFYLKIFIEYRFQTLKSGDEESNNTEAKDEAPESKAAGDVKGEEAGAEAEKTTEDAEKTDVIGSGKKENGLDHVDIPRVRYLRIL